MAEELLMTPEITMHEEPGEIRFNHGEMAVEIDDDEPESPSPYDIPADISITRVNRPKQQPQHSFLKVRHDLRPPPPHHFMGMRPSARPPPLIRAGAPIPGLPPMPRLKLGGARQQMAPRMSMPPPNPLVSMYNMLPPNSMMGPPPRVFHQQPPQHHPMMGVPRMRPPMESMMQPQPFPGNSLLRNHRMPHKRSTQRMPLGHQLLPQEPLPPQRVAPNVKPNGSSPSKPAARSLPPARPPPKSVQVPPPLRSEEITSNVLQNGGAYSFPNLNITVTSVPRKQPPPRPVEEEEEEEEEEEIDDEEEELEEELDDVEPPSADVVGGAAVNGGQHRDNNGKLVIGDPRKLPAATPLPPLPVKTSSPNRRRIGTLKIVRTADGYVRRQTANIINKAKAVSMASKKKRKRRFFRGGNYRFDGSSIKKRTGPFQKTASKTSSEAGSDVQSITKEETVDVLSYLGIQRKGSDAEAPALEEERSPTNGPKAKKSFRPSSLSPPALISSRKVSKDGSIASSDSLTIVRKRKSVDAHLSESSHFLASTKRAKAEDGMPKLVHPLLPLANEFEDKPLSRTRPKEVRNLSESTKLQPCVCDCNKVLEKSSVEPSTECQAIESVGVSRVGCKNPVASDFLLRRPSDKMIPALYCDTHVQRLKAHQSCGFCGEFCAHGVFLMCRPFTKAEPHLFHKSCYSKVEGTKKCCPHCSSSDKPLTVSLKLSMARMPLSLLQTVSKMSFVKSKKPMITDLILRRTDAVTYKMPNGKIISSEGLPEGLTDESLEAVIKAVEDKDKLKHTTRNMYTPTKAGDTVKILQLLSLGYSPTQKFIEAENGTALHVAAAEGHVLTAHVLVQAGAELDAIDDEQNTPLMVACVKGKPNIVRYLLDSGADLTLRGDDGMTCLHLAAQNGHLECVHVILTQNNLPRKFMNLQDEGGWTPLVWACENKHEGVINYLLEHGADPLITDTEGNISLHWAALSGSYKTCELLLNHGCDVNATNTIGETPMHIILRQDHYECAVLFLMRRARLDLKNANGQLPVECMVIKNPKCGSIVKLTTTLQELMKDTVKNRRERIITNDLTHGKETNPIQCVNDLDDESEPQNYVYVKHNVTTTNVPIDRNIATLEHCKCTDNCTTEDTCNCSDLSVKSRYDLEGRLKEGFDYKEPPMIFECNDLCRCNVSSCHNRVIQHGVPVRLQVFRAYGMGWGVRPLADISKGSFVCEYVGELISDSEAETREDSYLFDLDNKDGDTFCIDANNYGNIARFINHSCSPNLTPVKVFASHQDLRFPHIALFANRDIKKGEELGFDYGEKFWVIKHKFFTCHCSSEKCRYSRTNINSFLREYYKKNGEPIPPELLSPSVPTSSAIKVNESANAINQESQVTVKTEPVDEPSEPKKANNEKQPIKSKVEPAKESRSRRASSVAKEAKTKTPEAKAALEAVTKAKAPETAVTKAKATQEGVTKAKGALEAAKTKTPEAAVTKAKAAPEAVTKAKAPEAVPKAKAAQEAVTKAKAPEASPVTKAKAPEASPVPKPKAPEASVAKTKAAEAEKQPQHSPEAAKMTTTTTSPEQLTKAAQIVIPMTRVNVKAMNEIVKTDNASKPSIEIKKEVLDSVSTTTTTPTSSRPRRSVTRKSAANEEK